MPPELQTTEQKSQGKDNLRIRRLGSARLVSKTEPSQEQQGTSPTSAASVPKTSVPSVSPAPLSRDGAFGTKGENSSKSPRTNGWHVRPSSVSARTGSPDPKGPGAKPLASGKTKSPASQSVPKSPARQKKELSDETAQAISESKRFYSQLLKGLAADETALLENSQYQPTVTVASIKAYLGRNIAAKNRLRQKAAAIGTGGTDSAGPGPDASMPDVETIKREVIPRLTKRRDINTHNTVFTDYTNSAAHYRTEAGGILTQYMRQAGAYMNDGEFCPDEAEIDRAQRFTDSLKETNKSVTAFLGSAQKTETSKNVLEEFAVKAVDENTHIGLQFRIDDYKKNILPRMKQIRKINDGYDREMHPAMADLESAIARFKAYGDENFSGPGTARESRLYQAAEKAREAFLSSRKTWEKKKNNYISHPDLSPKRKAEIAAFDSKAAELTASFQTAAGRHRNIPKSTKSSDGNVLLTSAQAEYREVSNKMMNLLSQYNSSGQKWKLEEQQDVVGTTLHSIFLQKKIYADTLTDLKTTIRTIKVPAAASTVATSNMNAKHDAVERENAVFEKRHAKAARAYEGMRKFNRPGSKAPLLTRLIRRIREINSASQAGAEAVGSAYSGAAKTVLGGMEKVENIGETVGNGVNTVIGALTAPSHDESGNLDLDQTQENGGLVHDLAGGLADTYGDVSDALTDDSVMEHLGLDLDLPGLGDGAQMGLNIISTAKSGFSTFKEVMSLLKMTKGGGDRREYTKQIMSLVDAANSTFESIAGFFEEIPGVGDILGAISNAITILHRTVDLVRSAISSHSIAKKLDMLKNRVNIKNSQYQQEGDPATKDVYNMDSPANREKAGRYGFKTLLRPNQQLAAKAYAMKDTLAGMVMHFDNAGEEQVRSQQEAFDRERYSGQGRALKKEDVLKTYSANDFGNTQIATRRHALLLERKRLQEEASAHASANVTPVQKQQQEERQKSIKQKSRVLKALQDFNEISITAEADNRMHKKKVSDVDDIVTSGLDIAATFSAVSGPGVIASLAIKLSTAAYKLTKSGASAIRSFYRNQTGSFHSDANKKNRRSQMAETMYDRLAVLSGMLDASGMINTENMSDAEYVEAGDNFQNLNEDLISNLDAYISHIIDCDSREEMIASMTEAFGVAGN